MSQIGRLSDESLAARLALVLLLCGLFLMRVPDILVRPQFWAEDGHIFFQQDICFGVNALFMTYSGYYHLIPRLTAFLASFFNPLYAPAIYCGIAIGLTTMVLYLVLSPRLALPYKPLLAFFVVMTPHGEEVFANITNIQWYLPLGVMAVILMKPSASRISLFLEAVFIIAAGLTGPFMLLLLPVFAVKAWSDWPVPAARRRISALATLAAIASSVQLYALVASGQEAIGSASSSNSGLLEKVPMMARVTLVHFSSPFLRGVGHLTSNTTIAWVIIALIALVLVTSLVKRNFRLEKTAFFYILVIILFAGLYKSRDILDQLLIPGNASRYFFIPNIMLSWMLIFMLKEKRVKIVAAFLLLLLTFSAVLDYKREPLVDLNWPFWASNIGANAAMKIPINPSGWFIDMSCRSGE